MDAEPNRPGPNRWDYAAIGTGVVLLPILFVWLVVSLALAAIFIPLIDRGNIAGDAR